jgi:hypothetical protein
MDGQEPAKKPAKNTVYALTPFLPGPKLMGPLKDMAQQIITDSVRLEGKVASETAGVLGDKLRLINSYYSNLIEGHKTTLVDIEAAMQNRFDKDPDRKYAQELCAAHVQVEKKHMLQITASQALPISSRQYLCDLHRDFYTCSYAAISDN